jgi:hypothetical protein
LSIAVVLQKSNARNRTKDKGAFPPLVRMAAMPINEASASQGKRPDKYQHRVHGAET